METCINYTDYNKAFFSTDEPKWVRFIRQMAKERPDEVRIIKWPEENEGCLYCVVPPSWFKLKPKRIVSEEQRKLLGERINAFKFTKDKDKQEAVNLTSVSHET